MKCIIDFCNTNSGFISAILSIVTILMSVAAIIISILTALLPYKKRLRFYTGLNYDEQGNYSMDLFLFNLGNFPLYIRSITVTHKTHEPKVLATLFEETHNEKCLIPQQTFCSYHFMLNNCNANDSDYSRPIEIVVCTETKTFKETIGWAVG